MMELKFCPTTTKGMPQHDHPARWKAIVFDVDGTLYRLRSLQRAVQAHFLRGHWNEPVKAWRLQRAIRSYRHSIDILRDRPPSGISLADLQFAIAAAACGLHEDFIRECVRRWMDEEPLSFLRRFRYEGIYGILNEIRTADGARLAIFSDFPAQAKLRALGMEGLFEIVMSAHDPDVQRFKPDPRGLQSVLDRLDVPPDQAIYVGDRYAVDGIAAERAGMAFALAGDGTPETPESHAKLRKQLLPHLQK